MSILQNSNAIPTAGGGGAGFYTHQIANSIRADTNNGYLHRTPSSAGNRATWTFSTWIKLAQMGTGTRVIYSAGSSGDQDGFYRLFYNANKLIVSSANANFVTPADLFRDPSAWYNVVWKQGSNATTLYVNGSQIATASVSGNTAVNNNTLQCIGTSSFGGSPTNGDHLDGYFAETIMIDGTALDPTSFGESKNGVWIPKDASGLTYGTNGFRLSYGNASDLGEDSAGSNDWTAVNLATHDQMIDSPTFGSSNGGNFMTYNGAWVGVNNTLSEGNLQSTGSAAGNTSGTFGMITGKWYWECKASTVSSFAPTFGIGQSGIGNTDGQYYIITWQTAAGQIYGGGGDPVGMGTITVNSTGVTTLSSGDILSFWLDCDNGKLWIGKNGTIPNSGDPANGTNPQASWSTIPKDRYFTPTCQNISSGVGILNAGQNPSFNGTQTAGTYTDKNNYGLFVYDPSATDFIACCAANLPTNTLISPAETEDNYPQKLFGALAYSGDGGGSQTTGFQPDLVWVKRRNGDQSNGLWDSTRGTTKVINSDANGAQGTSSGLTAFNTDGYTMGLYYNQSGNTYASWSWRINGGTTATNTNGSVDSTVQVDPSGAFSLVKYRGGLTSYGTATVGHGLSKAPAMIIFKGYDNLAGNDGQWWVGHDALTSWNYLFRFNTDAAQSDRSGNGSMASPTSTVFSVNNTDGLGYSTIDNLAYCFTNVEGYCKVGSYVGNANVDGTFVYTGFSPKFFMCKPIVAGNWRIQDTTRSSSNVANKTLFPNLANAEQSYDADRIDILSNGVKMRASDSNYNQATTFVYLAMAENPFQFATAR